MKYDVWTSNTLSYCARKTLLYDVIEQLPIKLHAISTKKEKNMFTTHDLDMYVHVDIITYTHNHNYTSSVYSSIAFFVEVP